MKPFRAQRGAKIFDFRFTFFPKLKHFRAQRGAKFFDFSSINAKNNFELIFHYSFITHHAPGIINNFFHNGLPPGRINYYNDYRPAGRITTIRTIGLFMKECKTCNIGNCSLRMQKIEMSATQWSSLNHRRIDRAEILDTSVRFHNEKRKFVHLIQIREDTMFIYERVSLTTLGWVGSSVVWRYLEPAVPRRVLAFSIDPQPFAADG